MPGPDFGNDPDPYLANRDLIERVIGVVSRRRRLSAAETREFASEVHLHLIDRDHAVLRAFQGRSSLQVYLLTVVIRCYRDWRNAEWGKWRPSAEAKRLGPMAVQLETLVVRDRLTFDQAEEVLRTSHGFEGTRQELEALSARFPSRPGRTFVTEEALEDAPAPTGAEVLVADAEALRTAGRAWQVIEEAQRTMTDQDRLLIRMRFEGNLRIADIARMLQTDQKPLYRRLDRLMQDLRRRLEAAGISADDAETMIRHRILDRIVDGRPAGGKIATEVRPSDRDDTAPLAPERVP